MIPALRFAAVALLALAACTTPPPVGARFARDHPSPQTQTSPAFPILEENVAVPMRDGVVLRADVRRPASGGPFPVLVYRTPYGKQLAAEVYDTHLEA